MLRLIQLCAFSPKLMHLADCSDVLNENGNQLATDPLNHRQKHTSKPSMKYPMLIAIHSMKWGWLTMWSCKKR